MPAQTVFAADSTCLIEEREAQRMRGRRDDQETDRWPR